MELKMEKDSNSKELMEEIAREKVQKLRELSPLWEMIEDGIDLKSITWTGH